MIQILEVVSRLATIMIWTQVIVECAESCNGNILKDAYQLLALTWSLLEFTVHKDHLTVAVKLFVTVAIVATDWFIGKRAGGWTNLALNH